MVEVNVLSSGCMRVLLGKGKAIELENYFFLDYICQLKHITKPFLIVHWKSHKAAYKHLTYFGMIHFQYH